MDDQYQDDHRDPEIAAMAQIAAGFALLAKDPAGTERARKWVMDRYNPTKK